MNTALELAFDAIVLAAVYAAVPESYRLGRVLIPGALALIFVIRVVLFVLGRAGP